MDRDPSKGTKPVPLKAIQDAAPEQALPQRVGLQTKCPRPKYINEKHRLEIGNASGIKSLSNPLGLSRKQHVVLKHLKLRDNYWDMRSGRDSNSNGYGMNMMSADEPPLYRESIHSNDIEDEN